MIDLFTWNLMFTWDLICLHEISSVYIAFQKDLPPATRGRYLLASPRGVHVFYIYMYNIKLKVFSVQFQIQRALPEQTYQVVLAHSVYTPLFVKAATHQEV